MSASRRASRGSARLGCTAADQVVNNNNCPVRGALPGTGSVSAARLMRSVEAHVRLARNASRTAPPPGVPDLGRRAAAHRRGGRCGAGPGARCGLQRARSAFHRARLRLGRSARLGGQPVTVRRAPPGGDPPGECPDGGRGQCGPRGAARSARSRPASPRDGATSRPRGTGRGVGAGGGEARSMARGVAGGSGEDGRVAAAPFQEPRTRGER